MEIKVNSYSYMNMNLSEDMIVIVKLININLVICSERILHKAETRTLFYLFRKILLEGATVFIMFYKNRLN